MTDWLGTLGGIVALVVFLGAAVVYIRGSKDKGTITTLESSNRALTERVKVLEDGERLLKAEAAAAAIKHTAEVDALTLRVTRLEQDNTELRAQRPSAEAIEALFSLCQSIHSDTNKLVKWGAGP